MATTRLFAPWWMEGGFNSEVAGAPVVVPEGTDVDNTLVSAVQAAATASGTALTTGSAGGAAMPVLEDVYVGTTAPGGNNHLWIDITTPTLPVLKWFNTATTTWVVASNPSGGAVGALLAANNLNDVADPGSSRLNLHVGLLVAKAVQTINQALTGKPIIDSYQTTNNDLVLLTAQTTASQNGLWRLPATGSGAWARPTDFPSTAVITEGPVCRVTGGAIFAGSIWVLNTTGSTTVDTTAQTWIDYTDQAIQGLNLGSLATQDAVQWIVNFPSLVTADINKSARSDPTPYSMSTWVLSMSCETGPVGSALTAQIRYTTNGGSSYTNLGSALSIISGASADVGSTPSVTVPQGAQLDCNVTSVGSGTAATIVNITAIGMP